MPAAVQYLTYLNPVRYFLEIVRGIFLKGSGPAVLWPQMLALGGVRSRDPGRERPTVSQEAGITGTIVPICKGILKLSLGCSSR